MPTNTARRLTPVTPRRRRVPIAWTRQAETADVEQGERMATKALNRSLQEAKKAKKDEFYTQLADIERELKHYKKHFKGKVVYCNCDDPRVSNFFHYFSYNFEKLG